MREETPGGGGLHQPPRLLLLPTGTFRQFLGTGLPPPRPPAPFPRSRTAPLRLSGPLLRLTNALLRRQAEPAFFLGPLLCDQALLLFLRTLGLQFLEGQEPTPVRPNNDHLRPRQIEENPQSRT